MAAKPPESELISVVHRNIRALMLARAEDDARRPFSDRFADRVTRFTGSMTFVLLHALLVLAWLVINLLPNGPHFSTFSFLLLETCATVETIFLSTFVLISQNRMQRVADRRADLDLQINLLAEHEVTRVVAMVEMIAKRLEIKDIPIVEELKRDIEPATVLREIEREEDEPPRRH